ncbi:hypothetical protein OBBRIDRAFT_46548 [Obba rivulosa]|uniref:Uncharacterized protein n=1 Tax=Obba rivulosa TaxID=1052685 RepID=A0A8E2AQA6_9APHY|nr:hypothetical protein OBBRIDRAFT_46548 [Obba rivulosa]
MRERALGQRCPSLGGFLVFLSSSRAAEPYPGYSFVFEMFVQISPARGNPPELFRELEPDTSVTIRIAALRMLPDAGAVRVSNRVRNLPYVVNPTTMMAAVTTRL